MIIMRNNLERYPAIKKFFETPISDDTALLDAKGKHAHLFARGIKQTGFVGEGADKLWCAVNIFSLAVILGKHDHLLLLLKSINTKEYKWAVAAALSVAAINGDLHSVQILLDVGKVDPLEHDSHAVLMAIAYQHIQVMEKLLTYEYTDEKNCGPADERTYEPALSKAVATYMSKVGVSEAVDAQGLEIIKQLYKLGKEADCLSPDDLLPVEDEARMHANCEPLIKWCLNPDLVEEPDQEMDSAAAPRSDLFRTSRSAGSDVAAVASTAEADGNLSFTQGVLTTAR